MRPGETTAKKVSPRLNKGKNGFNWVNWAGGVNKGAKVKEEIGKRIG